MPDYEPLTQKVGVLGRAPEFKDTSKGRVMKFSLAVPKQYAPGAESTEWVSVAVWNEDLQTAIGDELYKGAKVAVEGNLKTRTADGRTYTDLTAFRVGLVAWIAKKGTSKAAGKIAPVEDDDSEF